MKSPKFVVLALTPKAPQSLDPRIQLHSHRES
jgi:hypothetical protein